MSECFFFYLRLRTRCAVSTDDWVRVCICLQHGYLWLNQHGGKLDWLLTWLVIYPQCPTRDPTVQMYKPKYEPPAYSVWMRVCVCVRVSVAACRVVVSALLCGFWMRQLLIDACKMS